MKTKDQVSDRLRDLLQLKEDNEPAHYRDWDEQLQWAYTNATIETLIWVLEDETEFLP